MKHKALIVRLMAVISAGVGTFLLAAAQADASIVVTLREEAYVRGPQVSLRDVADIQGNATAALYGIEIVPAAPPGNVRRIHASLLRSRLVTSGFEPNEFEINGAESVNATTLHVELSSEMLVEDLRRYVLSEMPWERANAVVDITSPPRGLMLPEGDLSLEWTPTPLYRFLGRGTIRGEALVDGEVRDVIYCKIDVQAYEDVVVAAKDIPRGAIISQGDLMIEKRALSTMRNGYYRDPHELVGMVARSTIFPDTVLSSRHAMPRRIIRRNQIVTVEVKAGSLVVRDRALAMGNAAAGDLLICRRMDSREEFQGTVRSDGVVVVE